jgi:hypothetical protein
MLDAVGDGLQGVNNGRMVTPAQPLAYVYHREAGVPFGQ